MVRSQSYRRTGLWGCLGLVCVVLVGCADAANQASKPAPVLPTPEPVPAQIQISIAVDEQQRLCGRGQVTASLSIDGVRSDNLTVDCVTNLLNHSLTGIVPGLHTFNIEVSLDSILIYRVSAQATLVAGTALALSFSNPEFIDSDGDGFSNLAELMAFGRYTRAWLDAGIRPAEDMPRFAKNYVVADHVGETFTGGSSGSANYLSSADF